MAPTATHKRITRPAQRARRAPKFRKHQKKKDPNRVQKLASRSSPRSKLGQGHGRTLGKQTSKRKHKPALTTSTTTNQKPTPTPTPTPKAQAQAIDVENKPKASPRTMKYQLATQWPSSEPYEVNCLQRDPLPAGYVFVPRGDVYITRNCRSKTKESRRVVYKIYDNTGKKPLGIRVPHSVQQTIQSSAKATASTRAAAVAVRDEKDLSASRSLLRTQFSLMPNDQLESILHHAYLKGSGRVGRTSTTSDRHKAVLAVEAHIRHTHTPYEALLKEGKDREAARKAVWPAVQAIRAAWMGEGTKEGKEGRPKRLSLRSSSG
ncbi:hypothetical protein BDV06DRAFT_233279 [Aspergillus oleicola]